MYLSFIMIKAVIFCYLIILFVIVYLGFSKGNILFGFLSLCFIYAIHGLVLLAKINPRIISFFMGR